jgi:3-(3-hydroxy-phenyl)propionate hydroxylase
LRCEARGNAPVKLEVRKPPLGPGLAIGSLPFAGHLAPQFTLADGCRSDDRTGYANVLLVEKGAALSAHIRAALARAGTEWLTGEDTGDLASWLRANDLQAALVRPDRYVRGAARSDKELEQLVQAAPS